MKLLVLCLVLLPLLGGCTSLSRHLTPGTDLGKVKFVFVERRLADNNNVRDRIVRALQERGLRAEAGPLTLMPEEDVDAVLVYEDRWAWDFRTYMIELRLTLRDAESSALLASALLYRRPLSVRSTDAMVNEAVAELFKGVQTPAP